MIRRARHDDLEAIITLGTELTKRGAWSFTEIEFKPAMDRLLHALRSPREAIFVATHGGKLVGFMILVAQPMWWNPMRWQVIDDIIFCARAGLGNALLRAGIEWAHSLPTNVCEIIISLNANIDTERAAKALEAHGMTRRGVTLSYSVTQRKQKWAA